MKYIICMLKIQNYSEIKTSGKFNWNCHIFPIVKSKGYFEIWEINAMTSFHNSIRHSISIHFIFLNSIKLHIISKEEKEKRKHVVETTPLTIKLSKWYGIYQFIKQKNISMIVNFHLYKEEIEKRILNKSQSDLSDISHILTYFLCDGLGSTHKKWYWYPTGLKPSQRTVSFQFFFKCPTEIKIWSYQLLTEQACCNFMNFQRPTFCPWKRCKNEFLCSMFSLSFPWNFCKIQNLLKQQFLFRDIIVRIIVTICW